jgi:tetratricopeptide (TPR) repeat protein
VFAGGWTLEAAQAVCDGDVLELTNSLVKKSLILANQKAGRHTRYHFHEVIRQYAHEKLVRGGEEEGICRRHLKYFLMLSRQAELGLIGSEQVEWYNRIVDERDNLRSALRWADNTDIEAGLYISGRIDRFWTIYDFREGNYWLSKFLQKPESYSYPETRAKALKVYGWILISLQQFDAAHSAAEECMALCRAIGDKSGEVDALLLRGVGLSNTTQKLGFAKQALELAQLLGDVRRQAKALERLGWVYEDERRFIYWEKAIELSRQLGDWRVLAGTLSTMGLFLVLNGSIESAEIYLDESNTLYQQLNIKPATADLLSAYGQIALIRGNFEKARAYFQESAKIGVEFGSRQDFLWSYVRLGYVALHQGMINEARQIFTESVQNFQKDKYNIGVIFALEGVAGLDIATDKPERAARLIGWADTKREEIGDSRWRVEQAEIDKIAATCNVKMGKASFSEAYQEGKKMSLDEAIADALQS